jgi:hypothetical protein
VGDIASSSSNELLNEGIHAQQQRVHLREHGAPENSIITAENTQPAISGSLHI